MSRISKNLNQSDRPTYRPDIDGIRAIAICSVVAFHAFPSRFPGGFVGVDIFFVVSGFLISTIIYKSLSRDRFSFTDFYARRVRRIFPALILVMGCCLWFGWFVLFADEYKQLGKHVAASAGFVQNFALWKESGYFDISSQLKPLMHLWSLAIEEQFYLLFPLTVWLIRGPRFNPLPILILTASLSFAVNLQEVYIDPAGAFFSPQTRFWQLMAGAALSWLTLRSDDSGKSRGYLSFLGLGLICISIFAFSEDTLYPNWQALAPVTGTVLLIMAGSDAWINRILLSNRVAVGIGLISYPLYLWHWPLLSFVRIMESQTPKLFLRVETVAFAVLLSVLTYVLVEKPIRYGKAWREAKALLLVGMLVITGIGGYYCFAKDGFPSRMDQVAELKHIGEIKLALGADEKNCQNYFPHWNDINDNTCMFQKDAKPSIVLIGDSHARHLYPGLRQLLPRGENLAVFPASCAAPFIDVLTAMGDPRACALRKENYKRINSAIDYVLKNNSVKLVILGHNPLCSIGDAKDIENPRDTNSIGVLKRAMRRTFLRFRENGKKVIIALDGPRLEFDPQLCKGRPMRLFSAAEDHCSMSRSVFDANYAQKTYREIVREVLVEFPEVRVFDVANQLCDDEQCYVTRAGKMLYEDREHLGIVGSEYVAVPLLQLISSVQGGNRANNAAQRLVSFY